MQARGLTGSAATVRALIRLLETTPPNNDEPVLTKPTISVRFDRVGPTFTVSGTGFLPNHVVHIRVVNNASLVTVFFDAASDSSGRINHPITFEVAFPQRYSFSANDERRDSGDLTGTLWSNTVTITAT
jgi:hypothetical protein